MATFKEKVTQHADSIFEYINSIIDTRGRSHIQTIMKTWNTRDKKKIATWVAVFAVTLTASTLIDIYLPHTIFINVVKWILFGGAAIYSGFSLAYMLVYAFGQWLTKITGGRWVPLKQQPWASFKARIWVVAALCVAIIGRTITFGNGDTLLWSLVGYSSIILITLVATFLLKTEEEIEAKTFGIRDERTKNYDKAVEEFKQNVQERKDKAREKAENRTKLIDRLLGEKQETTPDEKPNQED